SGKDRETNDGSTDDVQGGTQTSNPDNDGRGPERNSCKGTSEDRVDGCADKPGGTGGVDTEDQDWNNGCGNDDDFEDDNEGLCGGPDRVRPTAPDVGGGSLQVCPPGTDKAGTVMTDLEDCVEDEVADTTTKPDVRTDEVFSDDTVLGERIFRAPARVAASQEVAAAGAPLPFTGGDMVPLGLIGLALIGTGWMVVRREV
ncbi:MAG: hypothetical protein M3161_00240, partial [Actinomycetota bacterium]|nr:hypothetical protein [Actinomycetota bacterium]